MDATRQQLIEARRTLSNMVRACRQAVAFLDGISAMDKVKMKRALQDAARRGEEFLAHE